MHICYNADVNYLRPLLISIYSVCKNNESITFHVINYGGIEEHHFNFLTQKFKISVKIYNANTEMLTMQGHGRFPPVVFGRLFIPEIIKTEKILYLDVDTVITSNLSGLWEQSCEYLKAVEEVDSKISRLLKTKYSLDNYYNAGVLFINNLAVKAMFKKAVNLAKKERLDYLDQDALNIALNGNIEPLDCDFNFMSISNKSNIVPTIIHFAHLKPWKGVCLHQYSYIYKEYETSIIEHLPESDELKKMSLKELLKNIYLRFFA